MNGRLMDVVDGSSTIFVSIIYFMNISKLIYLSRILGCLNLLKYWNADEDEGGLEHCY